MIAVMFKRLGPYHHARLAALSARTSVTAIEIVRQDDVYRWRIDAGQHPYEITRVFEREGDMDGRSARTRVREILDRLKPEVVCIPGWASVVALWALDWCLANDVPAVLLSDSTAADVPRSFARELPKSLIVRLFSAAVVAGSRHADYARALGMPEALIFQGYDVVDNRYFADQTAAVRANGVALRDQHGLPQRYFLASARFVAKKNIPGLLKAYAAYLLAEPREPWSLVVLGDGEMAAVAREKMVEHGIGERGFFPGFKQYEELPVYYGLASAFVHASTSEQWGLVVNEAMAAGLPVIVSDRCGCADDLVENGVTGFVFDPEDTGSLAKLMLRMSEGAIDLAAMGRAASERIGRWSPELFADSVIAASSAARLRAASRRVPAKCRPLLRAAILFRGYEIDADAPQGSA